MTTLSRPAPSLLASSFGLILDEEPSLAFLEDALQRTDILTQEAIFFHSSLQTGFLNDGLIQTLTLDECSLLLRAVLSRCRDDSPANRAFFRALFACDFRFENYEHSTAGGDYLKINIPTYRLITISGALPVAMALEVLEDLGWIPADDCWN